MFGVEVLKEEFLGLRGFVKFWLRLKVGMLEGLDKFGWEKGWGEGWWLFKKLLEFVL